MENRSRGLQEPFLQSESEPLTQQELILTFANGVTRSVSRRHESISCTPEWIWGEVRKQLHIAGPIVCVSMIQYLLIVVSLMFVGHLGELQLASAAIASSFAGVTGSTLLQGMASALETLCGQSYGAKQYHMLGIHMQRAMLVLWLVSVPIAVMRWNMNSLLLYQGQDLEIAEMAGEYARYLVPTLFGLATLQPLIKFLLTQSVVLPMALMSGATLSVHIPLFWVLVFKLGFGHRSAAIATSISTWLNVVFLGLYVKCSSTCKRTWTSFSGEAFHELSTFCKLAVPSAIMICPQYWSFEGLVLLSGPLPNPQLETSSLSICFTSDSLLYMIPFGIGASASTRVGNELGAGRPQAAKAAVIVSVSMGM
ncbi:protein DETOXIFICATION 16 [Physcomitrium patens]|uniref:Protein DETOXIFICATION n=1 Tax=Physcomitrium patens TaxID=3218 RepID=A0A2K1LBC2_PHYPA|nr:protein DETOXIFICATION 16-like [Physcomitrium patens]PNR63322.1 hypothetical protein PHYPA_001747 [Physcomitrium patens]|eukprot:XP_024384255.1 protein DETOXIFICATION 16-like [Physcomitrella patens]